MKGEGLPPSELQVMRGLFYSFAGFLVTLSDVTPPLRHIGSYSRTTVHCWVRGTSFGSSTGWCLQDEGMGSCYGCFKSFLQSFQRATVSLLPQTPSHVGRSAGLMKACSCMRTDGLAGCGSHLSVSL
ncbi:unnamed protein product [Pipistrellus nathusii]|uniref:Uncharacterized protein n=1 Tax=Pipistrellus nathusii TaxID=59473 RepID=A0ABP0A3A7_PIPNA